MADASAAALAETLVISPWSEVGSRLAAVLRDDPPLLIWAICRAGRRIAFGPDGDSPQDAATAFRSVTAVASWLAEHAPEALQWPAGEYTPWNRDETVDVCVERVIAAAAAAESARQPALGGTQAEQDWAELCGLLHGAEAWLPGANFAICCSGGIVGWAERSEPHQELTEQAAEVGRRWRAEIRGAADWLP